MRAADAGEIIAQSVTTFQKIAKTDFLERDPSKKVNLSICQTFFRGIPLRKGEINARQLANVAYGVSRSGFRSESLGALFAELAGAAVLRACRQFNTQELANTAWAYSTADQPNEKLFVALAEATERRMSGFSAQEMASTA